MKPLELGGHRQLFIDDGIIGEIDGVVKTMNQPVKYAGNPILRPSPPWEHDVGFAGTVIRDPDDGTFRAWYQGWFNDRYPACYATSSDGIHWHKPELGLVEESGSSANNRVLNEACVPNVMFDARDPDPDRRYKMLYWDYSLPRQHRQASFSVAFSPDGIHWNEFEGNPVRADTGDTHSLLGWDESVGKYVAYIRPGRNYEYDGKSGRDDYIRLIGRSVSDDFESWSEPEVVLGPDEDEPNLEFYGMPAFRYEGLYLGLPWAYHTYPEETYSRAGGTTDIQLAVSRDGIEWERAGDRQAFIPLGPPGSFDQGILGCAKEPVRVGDELWFYLAGSDGDHGSKFRNARGFLAKLRLDGFVSVDASDTVGTVTTKPFQCDGGTLSVNADARGGTLAVAVIDESGYEAEGMPMIDCAVMDVDSVRQRVTWRDHVSLDHLKGQAIRLKFYLRSARLYSFALGEGQ